MFSGVDINTVSRKNDLNQSFHLFVSHSNKFQLTFSFEIESGITLNKTNVKSTLISVFFFQDDCDTDECSFKISFELPD